jgi:sugar phosphate isomerase/epimerase
MPRGFEFDAEEPTGYAMDMQAHSYSRRNFLKTSATAAAMAAVAPNPAALFAAESYGGNKIPFGLQLYSVRTDCAKDLNGTVAAVAKMGYKAVEFAGYYGRDAKTLRKLLDDIGLKCCGTHTGLDTLLSDNLAKTVEFNQILGNPFLIVPSLSGKYTKTRQGWQEAADLFNEIADKVKPQGMKVGYHNHSIEFKPIDGEVPWDTFFNRAKREVVVQFDTGNGVAQGGDPVVYLKKQPGRVASVHVKPYSKAKPNALIGDDELPWKEIFNICETTAGVQWYIIEYESDAYPPLVSVQKTLDVMRHWGKC